MNEEFLLHLSNIDLIKICKKLKINYKIYYQLKNNSIKSTYFRSDKITLVEKILTNNKLPIIYFKNSVYDNTNFRVLTENDLVLYKELTYCNQYVIEILKKLNTKLTKITFYIAKQFWIINKELTYLELANLNNYFIKNPNERIQKCFNLNKYKYQKRKTQKEFRLKVFEYYKIDDSN